MAGDAFTAQIFAWLNRVAADRSLPAAAFKLAYAISQYVNRETGKAWPSQETLACKIGFDAGDLAGPRQVRRLLKVLVERRYLLTTRRKHQSLVYELIQERTNMTGLADENENVDVLANEVGAGSRPDNSDRSSDQDRTNPAPRPDILDRKTGRQCPPNHLKNHLGNHEGERRTRAKPLPNDFRLDRETRDWALSRLGSHDAVEHSMFRFTNHYRQAAGSRGLSTDWMAKARLWIDDDDAKQRPDKSVIAAADRLAARIASFDALPAAPSLTHDQWDKMLASYVRTGRWTRHVDQCGSEPPSPDCRAPRHLLIRHGLLKETAA